MGLREEKKRELRSRILTTTLALFSNQGFGRTRVADVAAALRISEATFFNYFPTKQAVLDALLQDAVGAAVARAFAAQPEPALSSLSAVGAELATEFDAETPLARLLARDPELLRNGLLVFESPPRALTSLFADLQVRGVARADMPAQLLGRAFLAMVWVAAYTALDPAGPADMTMSQALSSGVDLFIDGLRVA